MLTDHRCTKYTDCSSCSFYQRDIFKYRLYPKGYVIPQTRCCLLYTSDAADEL